MPQENTETVEQEVVEQTPVTETPPVENTPTTTLETSAPSIDPNVGRAIAETVRAAEQRAQAAERRMQELEERLNKPAPVPIEDLNKQYYDNPVGVIRDQVKKLIDESIAPLNQFRQEFARERQLSEAKASIKNQPHFATLEPYIDQILGPSQQITPQLAQQAYTLALGYAFQNDLLQTQAPAPTPTPTPTVNTPPHRAPSPPPAPARDTTKVQRRALTENERFLMRQSGMTEDQWWEYMDTPANQVVK